MSSLTYIPQRNPRSVFVSVRGLRYHAQVWGDASLASAQRPPLVMAHGWMDVGASFQFVVDALAEAEGFERWVIAPDWRGFGLTETPAADCYWFPDYLADLDALLDVLFDALVPAATFGAIDLLGHSMGGNVVMSYAGLRRLGVPEATPVGRDDPALEALGLRQRVDDELEGRADIHPAMHHHQRRTTGRRQAGVAPLQQVVVQVADGHEAAAGGVYRRVGEDRCLAHGVTLCDGKATWLRARAGEPARGSSPCRLGKAALRWRG